MNRVIDFTLLEMFFDRVNSVLETVCLLPREEIIKRVLVEALVFPVEPEVPQVATMVRFEFRMNGYESKLADILQLNSLTTMTEILTRSLSDSEFKAVIPYLATSMSYYFWEIGSDNIATLDESRARFELADVVRAFNDVTTGVIALQMELDDALDEFDRVARNRLVQHDTGVTRAITGYIEMLMEKGAQQGLEADPATIAFVRDPNRLLCRINLRSIAIARDALYALRGAMLPDHHWLVDDALEGMINRYQAMNRLLDNPQMNFEHAVELGYQTILVQYTTASLMAFIADDELCDHLTAHQSTVRSAVLAMSYLSRLVNDGVGLLWDTADAVAHLDRCEEMGYTCFVAYLQREVSQNPDRAFVMQLKDLREREYNLFLNAGVARLENDLAKTEFRIMQGRNLYDEMLLLLHESLSVMDAFSVAIPQAFDDFIEWMSQMYYHGADFDKGSKETLEDLIP